MTAIWTIGHSTRTLEDFLSVLRVHEIECVVDVRRFPGSRRLPQFNEGTLSAALVSNGIAYQSLTSLGGRRRAEPNSINTGWRHEAFRGYADYLGTAEYAAGMATLMDAAAGARVAIMCAEILWWQCHRRLIADVLVTKGYRVLHIRNEGPADPHELREPAKLVNGVLSYAADQTPLF